MDTHTTETGSAAVEDELVQLVEEERKIKERKARLKQQDALRVMRELQKVAKANGYETVGEVVRLTRKKRKRQVLPENLEIEEANDAAAY